MMRKLMMKQLQMRAPDPEPAPEPEPEQEPEPEPTSPATVEKTPPNRTAMGDYIVQSGEKPLTSLGDPLPGPADYCPNPNLTTYSAPQYSIVGKQKTKQHGKDLPGPADYRTSGNLIWKKQYAIKGRGTCYFDEEASKYCTVIGPANYNVDHKHFGLEGPKYSMAHKQPGDIITGPPNDIVQPVDTHGFNSPGPNYRPNSHYWTRGPKKSMAEARKHKHTDCPGPADYDLTSSTGGPAHSFGIKLPPPPNVQRTVNKFSPAPNNYDLGTTIGMATSKSISGRYIESKYAAAAKATPSPATYYPNRTSRSKQCTTLAYRWFDMEVRKLSIASEPLPRSSFMSTMMDIRTSTARNSSVLDRYTSYSQLQPNHDLLSPRYFAGTPAPNVYNMKSSIGEHSGASMKGNRRRNFDRAKSDCAFLLPELIDGFPAPNSYSPNQWKCGLVKPGVSFKGKRNGPFPTNKGQMYIPPQYNERDKMSETYDTTSYVGKSSGVSFKGNRRRRINMEAKNANAGFLLPNLIEASPGPGSYNIKSTIGKGNGVSFKGRKTGPFQSNKGATYINPELNEKEMRPGHYTLASPIGSSTSVSFKGNRQRTFESAKQSNALFLLPNAINDTPGPGFYSVRSSMGSSDQSISFKGRKSSGPFQSNKGRTYIPIEMNEKDQRPAPNEYDISPRRSSRNSGVSLTGDRRRTIHDGRETNAIFLNDKMVNETPGPGSYEVKTDRSEEKGAKIKGRRMGPFQTTTGAMHISPEFDNKTTKPSPASYNVTKPTGKDAPSASFKGSRPKSLFGEPVRPGPGDYMLTTTNMRKDPAYTVRHRTNPSYPESLNYVSKGEEETPGPGNYQVSRDIVGNDSPAYSMKHQLKNVEKDIPAPNQYAYEKKGNYRGSKFSMGKRFDMPNSRKNNPGPGTYTPKLMKSAPKFSMKGRADPTNKGASIPAPNAYSIPPSIKMNDHKAGVTLKCRQSPYVYSGFSSSKIIEVEN